MRSPSVARVGVTVAVVVALVFGGAVGVAIGEHHSTNPNSASGPEARIIGTPVSQEGTESTGSDAVSFLFALRAGSMTSTSGGAVGSSSLVLTDVDPQGEWFTDRPARRSGVEDIDRLIAMFFGADAGSPPNATVSGLTAHGGFLAVVELSAPKWDAISRSLTVTATPLSDRVTGALPAAATDVVITVDSTVRSCQVNIAPVNMPAYGSLSVVSTAVDQGSGLFTGNFSASAYGGFVGMLNMQSIQWLKENEPQSSGGIWFYSYGTSTQGCAATLELTITTEDWTGPYTIRWSNPGSGSPSISIEAELLDSGTTITVDPSSTPDSQFAQWNLDVSVMN